MIMSHSTFGFGVPSTLCPHHFIVRIPRGAGAVRIIEDLGMSDSHNEIIARALIERAVWSEIAGPVQRLFNKRLKAHELTPSRWKVADNPLDRLLGKELCVLAWALEDLEPQKIGGALRNWLALRCEERWWLFGMAGAAERGVGWRLALRCGLGERPASARKLV